jgi:peptidylprolyl isomerase
LPTKVKGAPRPPTIELPTGPPPEKVVVEELKRGHGAQLRFAQEFTLNYVALDYETGEQLEDAWGRQAFTWVWGVEELVEGLEIGLEGMRVGGRRELIVPGRFAYGSAARIYLVELLRVKPNPGEGDR